MVNQFDPQAFGGVLARLDAQDRQLRRLEQDLSNLSGKIDSLIKQGFETKKFRDKKPDWAELLVGAILGAVAYFIGAKFIGG